ncbi:hypothetical protein [Bosea sp. (in: a-proteobacteria)]|uniref:hypothetical protein n=1 Tax=Bosea sp. (in: a-proteobacteria) TaxID=1871050 RepID=UPI002633EF06|nr:hypothetical protein [Bosea sp. (in: a-proteobacteria)]MCO5089608.1 hypothetical protein [Bosea sp. (in: a-proteobacteria)]
MAVLTSNLFKGDSKLEAAATRDPAHIMRGARGDHVSKIQTALNRVDNAGIGIDGSYGPETADAVLSFKRKRDIVARPRQQQADDIVGIRTIAALDAEMRQWELRPPKPTFAAVSSPNPMFGDTDRYGFSLARLAQGADGDWSRRDPSLPACQMVPLGATRVLVFTLLGGEGEVNFEFNGPGVCSIVRMSSHDAENGGRRIHVTVRGLMPAETELSLRLDLKRVVTVRLIVRNHRQRSLSVVHLGPVLTPGDDTYILDNLIPMLNLLFEQQVNLRVTRGWSRIQHKLPLNDDPDSWTAPNPRNDLYILDQGQRAPNGAAFMHWRDLYQFGLGADLLIFCGPNLKDGRDPHAIGAGAFNTGRSWVNIRRHSRYSPGGALTMIAAHELAHSIGANHITALRSQHYLMTSLPLAWGQVAIPSETLHEYHLA